MLMQWFGFSPFETFHLKWDPALSTLVFSRNFESAHESAGVLLFEALTVGAFTLNLRVPCSLHVIHSV